MKNVWQQLKAVFGREQSRSDDPLREDVAAIMASPLRTDDERSAIEGRLVGVLGQIENEVQRIKQAAARIPPSSDISDEDWLAGVSCADQACALYEKLHSADWTERAENASAVWAQAVLTVCPSYHHMVGPAMLANAECHEKLGNPSRAITMYRAVQGDFAILLNSVNVGDALDDEMRTAIESLERALQRLLEIDSAQDRPRREALLRTARALLG